MSYDSAAFLKSFGLSATTTSTLLLNENPSRQALELQNNTGGILYVGIGENATTGSLRIPAGNTWAPKVAPKNAIYLMAATAGPVVAVVG